MTFPAGFGRVMRRFGAPLAVALSTTLLAPAAAFAAEMKIAIIDLRRAVGDTEDGLRMKSKLQELFDVRQEEIDNKAKALNEAQGELEKLAREGKMPEAELRKKAAALQKQALEYQAAEVAFRKEMNQRENELMRPILTKLDTLVRNIASKDGYDMVVNRDSVPYFRGDLDITDRVIQMYNASASPEEKSEPKKDAPKKGAPKPKAAPKKDAKPQPKK